MGDIPINWEEIEPIEPWKSDTGIFVHAPSFYVVFLWGEIYIADEEESATTFNLCVLPEGYRPNYKMLVPIVSKKSGVHVGALEIDTDGTCRFSGTYFPTDVFDLSTSFMKY
jgi:hypothetical protein